MIPPEYDRMDCYGSANCSYAGLPENPLLDLKIAVGSTLRGGYLYRHQTNIENLQTDQEGYHHHNESEFPIAVIGRVCAHQI